MGIKKRELLFCLCSDLWSSVIHNLLDQSSCNILILNLLHNNHHFRPPELPVSKLNFSQTKEMGVFPVLSPGNILFLCSDSRYFQPNELCWQFHIISLVFISCFLEFKIPFKDLLAVSVIPVVSCSQRDFVELEITSELMYIRKVYGCRCYAKHFHGLSYLIL